MQRRDYKFMIKNDGLDIDKTTRIIDGIKTMKGRIEFFTVNLEKVMDTFGSDSDHSTYAFFLLQGARIGLDTTEIYKWAEVQMEKLEQEILLVRNGLLA